MYDELRDKAIKNLEEKREKKRAVHIVGMIFTSVAIALYVISLNFDPYVAFWIKFPILVLGLVYATIYFGTFGIPFISEDDELTDEEIEREIVKIYTLEGKIQPEIPKDDDALELKEIEALKRKWDDDEDFV